MPAPASILTKIRRYQTRGIAVTSYVVGPTPGDEEFVTIQAAIDRAVADGYTGGTNPPAQILIKPGQYNENLTLHSGIDLLAVDQGKQALSVQVVGHHTFSCTGAARNWVFISGISFTYNSDTPILTFTGDATDQRLVFRGCSVVKGGCGTNPAIDIEQSGQSAVEFYDSTAQCTGGIVVVVGPTSSYASVYFENSTCARFGGNADAISLATGTLGAFNSEFGGRIKALVASGPDPGDSYLDLTYCKLIGVGVEVLACDTSYGVSLRDCTIECDQTPSVTGAGVFYYSSVDYGWGAAGTGFATTLNGGAGALPLMAESARIWTYDNGVSGLAATNVQAAIDELASSGGGGGVEAGFFAANIDLLAAAQTTVYTVAANKRFIPKQFTLVLDGVIDLVVLPTVSWGTPAVPNLFVGGAKLHSSMISVGSVQAWEVLGDAQPAGTDLLVKVAIGATAAGLTATAIIEGILIDAAIPLPTPTPPPTPSPTSTPFPTPTPVPTPTLPMPTPTPPPTPSPTSTPFPTPTPVPTPTLPMGGFGVPILDALDPWLEAVWPLEEYSAGSDPVVRADCARGNDISDDASTPSAVGIRTLGADTASSKRLWLPCTPRLNSTGKLGLSLWFKPETDSSTWGEETMLFSVNDNASHKNDCYQLNYGGGRLFYLLFQSDGTLRYAYLACTFTAGVWYHVVGSSDGANHQLWVNNVEGTPITYDGTMRDQTGGDIYIGGYHLDYPCDAVFNAVYLWINHGLSSAIAAQLWNGSAGRFYNCVEPTPTPS